MGRYHIRNATKFVEFPATPAGLMQAKAYRKSHPDFSRRKIRSVLQLLPQLIECGTEYIIAAA